MTEHNYQMPELPQIDPTKELFRDSDNWARLWVLKAGNAMRDESIATPATHDKVRAARKALSEKGACARDADQAVNEIYSEDGYVRAKNELIGLLFDECDVVDEADYSPIHSLLVAVSERAVNKEDELLAADVDPEVREDLMRMRIADDFKGLYTLYIAGKSSNRDYTA